MKLIVKGFWVKINIQILYKRILSGIKKDKESMDRWTYKEGASKKHIVPQPLNWNQNHV